MVVTDHEAMFHELAKTKSPAIISILYPHQSHASVKKQAGKATQGTRAAWLERMPVVNFTHREYFEWAHISQREDDDLDVDKGPETAEEEEVVVSVKKDEESPPAKKRKRQEDTDDYLSFVERTMAAYKKL